MTCEVGHNAPMMMINVPIRSVAGFASARMYKVLKGQQWFRNALMVRKMHKRGLRDAHV